MLRSRDKGQNNKRSLTFCTGVKFSSWFDFNENGLKLTESSSWFRKGIVLHIYGVRKLWIKGSKVNGHVCLYRPYGLWSLNFDPSFDQNRHIKVYETIHFLNLQDNPMNLSPFSLKLDQLQNLAPVQNVNDLLLFWPLSGERNVVWISLIDIFAPYDPRNKLTCISS